MTLLNLTIARKSISKMEGTADLVRHGHMLFIDRKPRLQSSVMFSVKQWYNHCWCTTILCFSMRAHITEVGTSIHISMTSGHYWICKTIHGKTELNANSFSSPSISPPTYCTFPELHIFCTLFHVEYTQATSHLLWHMWFCYARQIWPLLQ